MKKGTFKIIRNKDSENCSGVICHKSIEVPEKPLSYKLAGARNIVTPTAFITPANNSTINVIGFNVLKIFIRDKVDSNYLKVFGIQKYKKHVITRLNRGCLEKGYRIELEISSQSFSGEFDCLLFSEQIYKFLKKFVDVNLFIELEVLIKPSGSAYIFK